MKTFSSCLTGFIIAVLSAFALAQAPVEISFYYPVAVGGPITKIVDGLAADFERENPGIKVKPIYSGSYQESITKALTAVKSNDAPTTSVLLSTDMYTLIDEDAVVPFDGLIKTPEDQAWSRASTRRSWKTARPTARSQHSVPAFDDRALLEQGNVRRRARSQQAARDLGRDDRVRAEAHHARRRARSPNGACRFRRRDFRTGCFRASRQRTTPS
jgi:hypothetical protein